MLNNPSTQDITRTRDDRKDLHNSNDSTDFKRARFMFWPIVVSVTLFFGYFDGIKGAFVGFLYGVAGGLFLLHERSRCNKK
jgi:hypothetical protein